MTFGIFDEAEAPGVERVTLSDRLRDLDLELDQEATVREAASVLREVKTCLGDILSRELGRRGYRDREYVLENLSFLYTYWGVYPRIEGLTLMDMMERQDSETRGILRGADLLDDAIAALDGAPDVPLAVDLIKRLRATSTRESAQGFGHKIICDGEHAAPVTARAQSFNTLEAATDDARWKQWLSTDTQDLCPACCQASGIMPLSPLEYQTDGGGPYWWFSESVAKAKKHDVPIPIFVSWVKESCAEEELKGFVGGWRNKQNKSYMSGYFLLAFEALEVALGFPPLEEEPAL
jgi:hypothetical protein